MADWTMKGLNWNNPLCIRTADALATWAQEIGFLPFFANEVPGFSAEEHTASHAWWTGNRSTDPWEWREEIAASHVVAYGKFFDGRAGFISGQWLPYFANARRLGWDFDGKWQDGRAPAREKAIMEHFMNVESTDEPEFTGAAILSTELKKMAGFGKGGEKNFPGILTGLQMQLYLVIAGFRKRRTNAGKDYGMPVSLLMTPESIWGYEAMTAAYKEAPHESWQRIFEHTRKLWSVEDAAIIKLIGKRPTEQ